MLNSLLLLWEMRPGSESCPFVSVHIHSIVRDYSHPSCVWVCAYVSDANIYLQTYLVLCLVGNPKAFVHVSTLYFVYVCVCMDYCQKLQYIGLVELMLQLDEMVSISKNYGVFIHNTTYYVINMSFASKT